MKIEIDARGQACPRPVILTKKELDKIQEGLIVTIVDNEVARENVSKFARSMGYEYTIDKKNDNEYHIQIIKGENQKENNAHVSGALEDMAIAFSSSTMGRGSEELGEILIRSFLYTVSETSPFPSTLLFYNSGVYLTCEGSQVLEDLIKLETEGVEILSCGTCLDFFGIKDKLRVGTVSNMYTIYEKLKNPTNTIIIG